MIEFFDPVRLSRIQFAITALYHFLFVPLTIGLGFLLAIMESVYVMTRNPIWKQMTQFWGLLFGINFAMGVATGLTMEFQFGMNWSYYSHYVGDIFGSLLAIEGLMAFFLEATLIGVFFFGWNKVHRVAHLAATWGIAVASNFSALWILIANGWMQHPVGSKFNIDTLRMELDDFYKIFLNPVAQCKFVHTLSGGYVTGTIFVMAISSWYLLKGRHVEIAKRSMTVAASFGLASALSVIVLGDESGYLANENQKMKIAAMEAVWETEEAPAPLLLFAIPDQKTRTNAYALKIPYLLGLIATRSIDQKVSGINDLEYLAIDRIRNGRKAYIALETLRKNRNDTQALAEFKKYEEDLGFGLLLKKFTSDFKNVDEETIKKAAALTVPHVLPLFVAFRIMVGSALAMLAYFVISFWFSATRQLLKHRWHWRLGLFLMPLPWLANSSGWVVAEYGRQPWAIEGILPTFLAASNNDTTTIWLAIAMFVILYTVLFVFDVKLLTKYIKIGPDLFSNNDK